MGFLRQYPTLDLSDPYYTASDTEADSAAAWLFEDASVTVSEASSGGVDWNLSNCCKTYEIAFLSCMGGYLFVIFMMWNTFIMKPMKLIAVFVHEFSHATACWMTGGKVTGIEVQSNEGGVTKYVGGCRCIIIPAGYIGGSFWGAFFIVMSGNRWASLVTAIIFCLAMLICLKFSPNRTMVFLNLGFIMITVLFIVIDLAVINPFLQFLTLFYGVFIGSFSVFDIYDDLVKRTVEGSDAHACHKMIPCCLPRCVGLQFSIVALAFQALGLYLALVWMSSV